MEIIAIDKKRYIAGAHWQTVDGGGKNSKQMLTQARKLNSLLDSSCNAVFLGRRQYGLVKATNKKIPPLPSLASSIRESGIDDALLKFCLSEEGNLWYVVAISGSNILPDGDTIFAEEKAADDLIGEITSHYEFDRLENFQDAVASFEFLEKSVTPHLKLRALHGSGFGLHLGIASAVLVLGFGSYQGFQYYQTIKANKAKALLFAQQAALKSQKIEAIKGQMEVFFPPVYRDKALAQDIIETCRQKMSEIPINSRGWENSGYACSQNSYLAFWKYQEGCSFLDMPVYSKVNATDPTNPVPLPQVFTHEYVKMGEVELLTLENAFSRLSEWARLVHGKLTVEWKAPVKKVVGKDAYFEGVEVVSPFAIGTWLINIEKDTYLKDLPANTQTIPGMVLNTIEKRDNLRIQGEIYVQNN